MQAIKSLSLISAGMVVGISAVLFTGVIQKNGFPQISHAQVVPPLPFICTACTLSGIGNRLQGKDLTNAFITGLSASSGDNFSGTNFTDAVIHPGHDISYTNFSGANFTNTTIQGGNGIENNDFTNANFTNSKIHAIGSGVFIGNDFTNADFTNADLTGSDFSDSGNVFTSVTWSNTTCPDGTNSDSNSNTCIGHLTP